MYSLKEARPWRVTRWCLAALISVSVGSLSAVGQTVPAYITDAVNDKGRPAADTMRDANRKPAETVAFSGVKPGDKVADFIAGGGYFTRIFSKAVGPQGHVYATEPAVAMMMGSPAAAMPPRAGDHSRRLRPTGRIRMLR